MTDFVKLSELVNEVFTVKEVGEYNFKRWDSVNNKMLISDSFEKGYRKVYPVVTDKGRMDLGSGQLGNLLEAVFYKGKSDLIGQTFGVKSNGKTGMEVRYFFNPVKKSEETEEPLDWLRDEPQD